MESTLTEASDERRPTRRVHAFTRTQVAIVDLIGAGQTDKEIAHSVGMSYRTVRTHLERLYELNDVHCRAALVALVAQRRQSSRHHHEPNESRA
jgi:DNA-binding CsgD family transcriptional regulator